MVTLTPVGPTTSSSSAVELTPPPGATTGAPPRPDTAGSMPTGSGGQALEPNPRASSQSMQPPPRADVTTLAQLRTQNPPPTTPAPARDWSHRRAAIRLRCAECRRRRRRGVALP